MNLGPKIYYNVESKKKINISEKSALFLLLFYKKNARSEGQCPLLKEYNLIIPGEYLLKTYVITFQNIQADMAVPFNCNITSTLRNMH